MTALPHPAPPPAAGQASGEQAEMKQSILRARALALAHLPEASADSRGEIDVVAFRLAHETYGLEFADLGEIYPLKDFTPLPGTPPYVLGLINLRGQVLSLVDLRQFFELPRQGLTDLNKVIVLRSQRMAMGILADVVLGVRSVSVSQLQAGPLTLTGVRAKYLRGVTDDRLIVLDTVKLLSDPDLIVHDTAEA